MKFWQGLTFLPTNELVDVAKCAEDAGFTGVILSDHVVTYQTQRDEYPDRDDGKVFWREETHWPDPWITISALAQATTRLQFTTAVYVLPLRDPFTVAKMLSTLAVQSNNRVALGAGIGWQQSEFELMGQNFQTRGKRTNEALDVIRKLTTGKIVQHAGDFYSFPPLCMTPAPTQPLPIYIGGESDAALKRAACQDGWIGTRYQLNDLEQMIARLNEARSQAGTLNRDFEVFVGCNESKYDTFKKMEDIGVTSVMTSSWPQQDDLHCNLSLDDKRRHIEDFAEKFIV